MVAKSAMRVVLQGILLAVLPAGGKPSFQVAERCFTFTSALTNSHPPVYRHVISQVSYSQQGVRYLPTAPFLCLTALQLLGTVRVTHAQRVVYMHGGQTLCVATHNASLTSVWRLFHQHSRLTTMQSS